MDKSRAPIDKNNKTLDLAVDAIKTLKELPGSTSNDIINYITKNYPIDKGTTRKQVQGSLKRGIAYGILIRKGGRYSLPIESDAAGEEIAKQEIGLIEMCRRRRPRRKHGRRKKMQKRSSRETAALRKRRCGNKHCPCSGSVVRKRINGNTKKKSGDQPSNLRTADSCCCVHYKSRRMHQCPRRCTNERDQTENANEFVTGCHRRRKSSRLERDKKKHDPRFDKLERSRDSESIGSFSYVN